MIKNAIDIGKQIEKLRTREPATTGTPDLADMLLQSAESVRTLQRERDEALAARDEAVEARDKLLEGLSQ